MFVDGVSHNVLLLLALLELVGDEHGLDLLVVLHAVLSLSWIHVDIGAASGRDTGDHALLTHGILLLHHLLVLHGRLGLGLSNALDILRLVSLLMVSNSTTTLMHVSTSVVVLEVASLLMVVVSLLVASLVTHVGSTLHHVVGGVGSSLLHDAALSQIWLEKHGEKLNQIVGSTLVVEKLLLLIELASLHGLLVAVLLVS